MPILTNAPTYQTTPTHDGSGMVVHSSIVDFYMEHQMESWSGYRYWLGITPFPANEQGQGIDAYEDPDLLASNDGVTWEVPNGIVNPLDDLPGGSNYNSDTELIYDRDEDCLRLYWREFKLNEYTAIHFRKIYADRTLSPKITSLVVPWNENKDPLSPAIWRESSNKWHMWAVSSIPNGAVQGIQYRFSTDGVTWGNPIITPDPFPKWKSGWSAWHVSIKPNYEEQRMEFCFNVRHTDGRFYLAYAECEMTGPTNIQLPKNDFILEQGSGWDRDRLYRSSFVIGYDENFNFTWNLWYTAYGNGFKDRHMGYTEGAVNPSRWRRPQNWVNPIFK